MKLYPLFNPFLWLVALLVILITACNGPAAPAAATVAPATEAAATAAPTAATALPTSDQSAGAERLTVMTHDSFNISPEVVTAFETANHVKLEFLHSGDAGAALNQAILSKDNPLADVFFGVDNTFFSRAIDAGIFKAYASPKLADVPDALKLDPENRLLPVDFGDVCFNYDKAWFAAKKLPPPGNLQDLTKPEYKGLTVVENPATSSPGLAFLLATVAQFGEAGYLDYWRQLKANDVLVSDGWEDAYYTQFSRYEGARPIVLSYASSPPAEVYFAKTPLTEAPTASLVTKGSCYRQIEFAGILAGTKKPELAQKLIDFMLSPAFQEDIPLQMFVFPANQTAKLPDVFTKYAQQADNPATLPPDTIAANREAWLNAWTETVLH